MDGALASGCRQCAVRTQLVASDGFDEGVEDAAWDIEWDGKPVAPKSDDAGSWVLNQVISGEPVETKVSEVRRTYYQSKANAMTLPN